MKTFTTIADLVREICESFDYGIPDDVESAIRSNRELFGRFEDINEETLDRIKRSVWSELYDSEYPWWVSQRR